MLFFSKTTKGILIGGAITAAAAAAVSFFWRGKPACWGVLAGGALAYVLFGASLLAFSLIGRKPMSGPIMLYAYLMFIAKMAFIGAAFFVFFRLGFADMLWLAASFAAFFTVFLILEISYLMKGMAKKHRCGLWNREL